MISLAMKKSLKLKQNKNNIILLKPYRFYRVFYFKEDPNF